MRRRTLLSGRAVATSTALPGFASAQQASPGIDRASKTVTVGVFTPTTGSVPFCTILSHATASCFDWANETHPLKGWKINCVTCDDGYAPARSVAVTRRLVGENKVFALAAPVGTAQSVAVIPYAKEVGLPMIGPIGGATALFAERLVFPLLPDCGWSAASNLDFAWTDLKAGRVALLWENDGLGSSAKRGFDLHMDPSVKAYRDNAGKNCRNDPIAVFGLNGWSNGALFVKGFQMLQASGKALARVNLVDEVETMSNQRVGGARNVRLKAGEHRGARQEGRVQAAPTPASSWCPTSSHTRPKCSTPSSRKGIA